MLQWKISKLINFRWPLQWRHVERDGVSNHQPHDCLLNRLFRRRSKKTSKLRVTGLCEGNSPGTGEFPAQRASYAENVSIWWRHHGLGKVLAKEETTHMMSPLIGLYIQNKYYIYIYIKPRLHGIRYNVCLYSDLLWRTCIWTPKTFEFWVNLFTAIIGTHIPQVVRR